MEVGGRLTRQLVEYGRSFSEANPAVDVGLLHLYHRPQLDSRNDSCIELAQKLQRERDRRLKTFIFENVQMVVITLVEG